MLNFHQIFMYKENFKKMKEPIEDINLEKYDTKGIRDNHINCTLRVIFRDYDKINFDLME